MRKVLALTLVPFLHGLASCNDRDETDDSHETDADTDADADVDDTGPTDADGDGWTVAGGDCDDGDPSVHPGAPEGCDGLDNDCDESVDLCC